MGDHDVIGGPAAADDDQAKIAPARATAASTSIAVVIPPEEAPATASLIASIESWGSPANASSALVLSPSWTASAYAVAASRNSGRASRPELTLEAVKPPMMDVTNPTPRAAGMLKVICISPEPIPARSASTADMPAVLQAGRAIPTPIPISANGITICISDVCGPKVKPIHASATACRSRATVIGNPGPTLSTHRPAGGSKIMQMPVVMTMTQLALPGE